MNGAQALLSTLVDSGVDTCFTNPGTSEMHFVAALDRVPRMRAVLTLFEGVATGAADGYARLADRPASTLLHLGPGLGNGLANLHNARRAKVPLVNIVGDHATYHARYDAPLQSDIEAVARTLSGWVRRPTRTGDLAGAAAETVAAAIGPPAQIATLILPADVSWTDVSWSDGGRPAPPVPGAAADPVDDNVIGELAGVLRRGEPVALLLGNRALREPELVAAARIAAATGCRLLAETFPARLARGAGRPAVERLAYLAEGATAQLAGLRHLILVDAAAPASFFAYPGRPSDLVPDGCDVHRLTGPATDVAGALLALAEAVGADAGYCVAADARPALPTGPLTAQAVCEAVGALLPDDAVVVDEGVTSSLFLPAATASASPHDILTVTGGAIGMGLPVATGAAVAAGGRPVLALIADGSSLYTFQALWTLAREGLNVTTVVFDNRSYAILAMELQRVGAGEAGARAKDLFDLSRPPVDFVSLSAGLGVPATRAETAEDFGAQLGRALAEPGPHLIDAAVPPLG